MGSENLLGEENPRSLTHCSSVNLALVLALSLEFRLYLGTKILTKKKKKRHHPSLSYRSRCCCKSSCSLSALTRPLSHLLWPCSQLIWLFWQRKGPDHSSEFSNDFCLILYLIVLWIGQTVLELFLSTSISDANQRRENTRCPHVFSAALLLWRERMADELYAIYEWGLRGLELQKNERTQLMGRKNDQEEADSQKFVERKQWPSSNHYFLCALGQKYQGMFFSNRGNWFLGVTYWSVIVPIEGQRKHLRTGKARFHEQITSLEVKKTVTTTQDSILLQTRVKSLLGPNSLSVKWEEYYLPHRGVVRIQSLMSRKALWG